MAIRSSGKSCVHGFKTTVMFTDLPPSACEIANGPQHTRLRASSQTSKLTKSYCISVPESTERSGDAIISVSVPISSVRIDTKILSTHILALGHHRMGKLTDQRKRELWGQFLNVNDKVFKDRKKLGLKFDGSISINGYSATIHFKKPGLQYGHRARKRSKAQMQEEVKQLYFEHHIAELREAPNIVSIDPGKRDLLFCRDIKKERPFRYTSNQRAVETKSRYFQRDMTERKINAG
ncbi:uncharacterized protein EV422DRAFT_581618, partial [Fimicolochytrium jonesii]|uniref:uncharacterized protein n=1 Tax=Fimicolochytrium jonesii TaxID=1396493 RepID=UPI0022FE3FD0